MSSCGPSGAIIDGRSGGGGDAPSLTNPLVLIDDIYPELATSDFVALGNVNVVINGRTWRIINIAAAQVFGIVATTGLRYNAPASNSEWTTASAIAAGITIPFASIPNYNPYGSYLMEFALSSSTQANGDRVCVTAFVNTTGVDYIAGGGRRTTAAAAGGYAQITTTILNPPDSVDSNTDDAFAVLMTPSSFNAFSGEYDFANEEFPINYPRAAGVVLSSSQFTIAQDPGYPTVGAGLCFTFPNTTGAAGTHDETVQRFRFSRVA